MVVVLLLMVITFRNGNKADISLRDFDTCWLWFLKLHFEDEVAFLFGLIIFSFLLLFINFVGSNFINVWNVHVHQLDGNNHFVGLMLESDFINFGHIVFEFVSRVRGFDIRELFSFDDAVDGSIGAIASGNDNINMILSLLYSDLSFLETQSTWEVFIKNCDFAPNIIPREPLIGLWVIKLNNEVKIWLPLFVINNWDLDFEFLIILLHDNNLVDMLVVLWGCS
jgi:hypothetical protein